MDKSRDIAEFLIRLRGIVKLAFSLRMNQEASIVFIIKMGHSKRMKASMKTHRFAKPKSK